MNVGRRRLTKLLHRWWPWWPFIGGAVAFALLHLHFVMAWDEVYAVAPWPGYERAAAEGLIRAWYEESPRSLHVTQLMLILLTAIAGLLPSGRNWTSAVALWAGVLLALMVLLITTQQQFFESNLWPLAVVIEPVRTGIPVFVGAAIAAGVRDVQGPGGDPETIKP